MRPGKRLAQAVFISLCALSLMACAFPYFDKPRCGNECRYKEGDSTEQAGQQLRQLILQEINRDSGYGNSSARIDDVFGRYIYKGMPDSAAIEILLSAGFHRIYMPDSADRAPSEPALAAYSGINLPGYSMLGSQLYFAGPTNTWDLAVPKGGFSSDTVYCSVNLYTSGYDGINGQTHVTATMIKCVVYGLNLNS